MNQIDPKMIQSFAPTGVLRVGINLGNPVLAGLDAATQKPKGVSIDIANEIYIPNLNYTTDLIYNLLKDFLMRDSLV